MLLFSFNEELLSNFAPKYFLPIGYTLKYYELKNQNARSVTRTRDLQISQEIKDASYKSPYESGAPTD
jgi:hypothetical protein